MTRAILASLILWPLYLGLFLVLAAIGLVILVPLSLLRAWTERPSMVYAADGTPRASKGLGAWKGAFVSAWCGGWLTWLWGNEEDGVTGPAWWRVRTDAVANMGPPRWRQSWSAYRWSALRNPVNNLRFVPVLCPVIDPARIRSMGTKGTPWLAPWVFTWQGLYAGILVFPVIRGQVFRFWLGWKLKPEDAHGVPDTDMRKPRCGFAIQFKRVG